MIHVKIVAVKSDVRKFLAVVAYCVRCDILLAVVGEGIVVEHETRIDKMQFIVSNS